MQAEWMAIAALAVTMALAVLRAATPIILAALGGLVSDLSGKVNVALEGQMLIAAFFGVIVSAHAPAWFPDWTPAAHAWLGCLAGVAAALAVTALMAVFHFELGADLIVAGIAVNILANGLTVFLLVSLVGDKGSTASLASPALPSLRIPGLEAMPLLDSLVNGDGGKGQHVLVYAAFGGAALLALFLSSTRYGLWLRAAGENPDAATGAGIPVKRVQYAALLLSGLLAALGGIYLSMGYLTLFQADMVAGRGFLALAAVFFAGRRPLATLCAAMLFGASTVLATRLGALELPTQLIYMVPPLITIAALVVAGARRSKTARHGR